MIHVSDRYKIAIKEPSRLLKSCIIINGNTYGDDKILSINYDENLFLESEFQIGSAIMSCLEVELVNDGIISEFQDGNELEIKIGIEINENEFEFVSLGLFKIEDIDQNKYSIKIYANDRMINFEKSYEPTLEFPCTLKDIALDICNKAGVTLKNDLFLNSNYIIYKKPDMEDLTLRQAIMDVAELAAGYARITRDGQLEIFNLNTEIKSDYLITGDNYITFTNKAFNIAAIDKLIIDVPGIKKEFGVGDNAYYIIDNVFCENPTAVIGNIYNVLSKINYVPYTIKLQGDPALQVGDNIVINNDGTIINTIITNRTLNYVGGLIEEYKAVDKSTTEKKSTSTSSTVNTGDGGSSYEFDTTEEVKEKNTFRIDDKFITHGYYKLGDSGGANYIVEDVKHEWSIELANGLYANIVSPNEVNYRQFGAYLDGIRDDYDAMKKCHAYADSNRVFDNENKSISYTCKVANHEGIIYKQSTEAITCNSDIDLSGSTLLVDDTNATWFGIYIWGDVSSTYWDYEISEEIKYSFTADDYTISIPKRNPLPENAILKIDETPYAVRDDDGYLYSVGRKELIIHGVHGICTSPFADDWSNAGGEEINCIITNKENDEVTTQKVFSVLKANYTFMSIKKSVFIGCDVILNMSPNRYASVLTVKNHNSLIKDFSFKPNKDKLHNTMYKNSMIYIQDSYNVTVKNIQGFNAAGMMEGNEKGTSGYILRLTNCSDVNVEDCNMQGYWGCNAMDSVKNIHFRRCHMNRLDVHDYFYNVTATECTFYHHAVQIGYGRGFATFNSCNFYYNYIVDDSYPEAYCVALNLTYGRIFEGTININDCNIYVSQAPDNEYNLVKMKFRPEATSITKHFKFPEIRVKNVNLIAKNSSLKFSYLKIEGSRNARTSKNMPTHVYGECVDNTVRWKYKGRAFDFGEDTGESLEAEVDDFLRISDSVLNDEGKTNFYNLRYYKCTKAGLMNYDNKPTLGATNITVGTAEFILVEKAEWRSRYNYNIGDLVLVNTSKFYNPYVYECIEAGVSNGEFPIHTTGTVLEGSNNAIDEPDLCWWTYIGESSNWLKDFKYKTKYTAGQRFMVDGKIYEVIREVETTDLPPFETPWLKTIEYGGGILKYIGNRWEPKKWYCKDSYCEADGRIYQLANHDGITTGILPTKGNPYCVDGDITWEYIGKSTETLSDESYTAWDPNTHYEPNTMIKVGNNVYEVQELATGTINLNPIEVGEVYMDGTIPLKYYGEHLLAWRTAGNSYEVGDIISDNTFLVICIKAGVTDSNSKWGPLESASGWLEDDTFVDGECIWRKLTKTAADGAWRSSSRFYPVGKFLLVSLDENIRVYEVVETLTGNTPPDVIELNKNFLDGTVTLQYKGLNNTWLENARYNKGDIVNAGPNKYRCEFDGRLELPSKSIFENITTNAKNGYIFDFSSSVNVPTKTGVNDWKVIVKYCDGLLGTVKGLPEGLNFFGGTNTINPEIKIIE